MYANNFSESYINYSLMKRDEAIKKVSSLDHKFYFNKHEKITNIALSVKYMHPLLNIYEQ